MLSTPQHTTGDGMEAISEYFWKQEDDIPAELGYPLFGTEHLMSIAITLIAVGAVIAIFKRMDGKRRVWFLKLIPVIMVFLELFKDLFLVSVHRFGIGYLPLHVCSIGIFVFLLREYLPWKRAKEVFGEIAYVLIMPASIAALIFADWTELYPVWNFINLHSYVWHGALVLYPLLLLINGDILPSIRHIHWSVLFLLIVVPPIYIFDKLTGCNYFFVNRPVEGSPLEWWAFVLGNPGYLVGYALMVLVVLVIVYLVTGLVLNRPNGPRGRG